MIDYTLPLDRLPDPLSIEPLRKPFDVTITPPGSKSITCRAYVLAALASGESRLIRPLRADDTDQLLKALCTLGAESRWEGEDVFIKGVNGRFPRGGSVNLGDGGTPTRFMIACACLAAEPVTVDGSERMRERPIAEGVEMLRQLGANIEYVEAEGRLPVRVTPATLKPAHLHLARTASSQFVSALLLIASWVPGGLEIDFADEPTSREYVHLTLATLMQWEADFRVDSDDRSRPVRVKGQALYGRIFPVEPDASGGAYWVVAAALTSSAARIYGLPFDSVQPDVYVARRLQPQVWKWKSGREWGTNVRWPVHGAALAAMDCDASSFPDGALALAVAAVRAPGTSRLTGLRTLRVKETDRIAALANELRKIGCSVETGEDWIEITPPRAYTGADDQREEAPDRIRRGARSGPSSLRSSGPAWPARETAPIIIETYNDHRMAMAFAVLGLAAPNGHRLAIRNPACVAKSYPTFWTDFARLYQ
jgi:3-phosphoshikimate 1-carboxyvinyltransferase